MISGNILIAEWINKEACIPKNLPKMTLKSTDGTYSQEMYVRHDGGLNYYYDRVISNLDMNKEYYIEVELTTKQNISDKKKQNANMKNMTVGNINGRELKLINNKLVFSQGPYEGEINTDLKTIELNKTQEGRYYISGNILIAEWINDLAYTPKSLPELTLKSVDGTVNQKIYVGCLEGISYYYDVFLDQITPNKQYYIEAKLTTEENTSNKKVQTVKLPAKELGTYEGNTIKIEDNKIKFLYNGEINTDLKTIELKNGANGTYNLEGEILIAEWINNVANVPEGLPKMTLKSTDNTYAKDIELTSLGGLSYKYVIYNIEKLNPLKEYQIEVTLTGECNIGTNKVQIAKLPKQEIGKYGTVTIYAENNILKINDSSLYNGEINTDLTTLKIDINEAGREYIKGNIIIAEWVNGIAKEPQGLPKMTLKSTDGTYSQEMYVRHDGGLNYYYDRVIYNLDTTKEYYIEVELTGNKNIGNKKKQIANIRPQENIGKLNDQEMVVTNNKLTFKSNKYIGEINTDLTTMQMDINEAGKEYIKGNIIIAEWINGVACEPQGLPKMTLKSTDGQYSQEMYVRHDGGLNYYYDRVIYNLDTSKQYYIEVELTGKNNISNKKKQKANIRPIKNIGEFKGCKIQIESNNIVFQKQEKMVMRIEEPNKEQIKQENDVLLVKPQEELDNKQKEQETSKIENENNKEEQKENEKNEVEQIENEKNEVKQKEKEETKNEQKEENNQEEKTN